MKKKVLALLLAFVLVLAACGPAGNSGKKPGGDGEKDGGELTTASTELTVATNREVENMDYVVTAKTSDHEINSNLIDGLLENDRYGKIAPALAEKWESNDDKSVWTFHLRDAVWVTNTGEEYGPVTADDFVTGLRHAAEFASETSWLVQGIIKGYAEYLDSDFSDQEWEKVGVKAVDEKTVEYTLENPTPYFESMTTYSILYPINKQFLETKGEGCKLGSPNTEKCDFGSVKLDSILYNGGYILTTNDAKSQAILEKNDAYWDADNVFMEKVTRVFDGGEDPYSTIKGYESGTYSYASLNPSWEDYDTYLEKYKDNAYYDIPNAIAFGIIFNFNRQTFDHTNYADKDKAAAEMTHKAIMNENFRKAVRAAYDQVAYLSVAMPEELAKQTTRNINNFPGAAGQGDTPYFDLVTEAYNEATGENRDLHDGQTPFFSKDEALAFIEKAKEEGITFPVHLDMLVDETSDTRTKRAQSMKKAIEDNTDGQIIIELVMRSQDVVQNIAYRSNDPAEMDYDISTFTGWGPDYADPKSFVDIYSPTTGYYMDPLGLDQLDENGEILNKDIKEAVGLMEYEKLYREADAINTDMNARYKAFAKADAYLIQKAIYIPTQMETRFQRISKVVPFSRVYSDTGLTEFKYKGLRLQEELVTAEEYNKAFEEWSNNR